MISKDNLTSLLVKIGFTEHINIYSKTIGSAVITVDTQQERITYPDGLTVNGEFTCNFSSPENFVVLECVHRLLEKGYKPEHIELARIFHHAKNSVGSLDESGRWGASCSRL